VNIAFFPAEAGDKPVRPRPKGGFTWRHATSRGSLRVARDLNLDAARISYHSFDFTRTTPHRVIVKYERTEPTVQKIIYAPYPAIVVLGDSVLSTQWAIAGIALRSLSRGGKGHGK